jgi:hypothetical protein
MKYDKWPDWMTSVIGPEEVARVDSDLEALHAYIFDLEREGERLERELHKARKAAK